MRRVRSPEGRQWEVRASRFNLPPWRENDFDPWNYTTGIIDGIFAFFVLLPVFMVIVPVAVWIAELPVALARGLFAREGWIEALTTYPQSIRITWRVSDRGHLAESFDRITHQLERGYEGLTFDGVEIVAMTPPAGLSDLTA